MQLTDESRYAIMKSSSVFLYINIYYKKHNTFKGVDSNNLESISPPGNYESIEQKRLYVTPFILMRHNYINKGPRQINLFITVTFLPHVLDPGVFIFICTINNSSVLTNFVHNSFLFSDN